MVQLSKDEAISLCDYLELNLIESIRADPDVDSIEWLRNMTRIWEKCKKAAEEPDADK